MRCYWAKPDDPDAVCETCDYGDVEHPDCGCSHDEATKFIVRWKWVSWEDFYEKYPLFRYGHEGYRRQEGKSRNTVAVHKPADKADRVRSYRSHQPGQALLQFAHGPMPALADTESFDREDYDVLELGLFPYDMDRSSALAAWDLAFGVEGPNVIIL
jgi:hypothetical protein